MPETVITAAGAGVREPELRVTDLNTDHVTVEIKVMEMAEQWGKVHVTVSEQQLAWGKFTLRHKKAMIASPESSDFVFKRVVPKGVTTRLV